MLGKKLASMKKQAIDKVKCTKDKIEPSPPQHYECLLTRANNNEGEPSASSPPSEITTTPPGTFPVYVGADRTRFVVPTSYLSHPLFKMMLEKAHEEFGFDQSSGLVLPCSVRAFQEAAGVIECCNGKFEFGDLVEEFI